MLALRCVPQRNCVCWCLSCCTDCVSKFSSELEVLAALALLERKRMKVPLHGDVERHHAADIPSPHEENNGNRDVRCIRWEQGRMYQQPRVL